MESRAGRLWDWTWSLGRLWRRKAWANVICLVAGVDKETLLLLGNLLKEDLVLRIVIKEEVLQNASIGDLLAVD